MAASVPVQQLYECVVCTQLPERNRVCPRCRSIFCESCLTSWWEKETIKGDGKHGSCPTCRLEASQLEFLYDDLLQSEVNKMFVKCECGQKFRQSERSAHKCTLVQQCPFPQCTFTASASDMEAHTAKCTWAVRYSMSLLVQNALDSRDVKAESVGLTDATYAKVMQEAQEARKQAAQVGASGPEGSVRHYITASDTLSGLAVKYETTVFEIKRLNRLTGELFSHQWIWVPRPANYKPDELDVPSLEAMIALRKRELVQDVLKVTKTSVEEAVSYLQMSDYDSAKAVSMLREDEAWERRQMSTPRARTLADFMHQCSVRDRIRKDSLTCSTCGTEMCLEAKRAHCARCGVMCCMDCHDMRKENAALVTKAMLGATTPSACKDTVAVCNTCYTALHGGSSSSSMANVR